MIEWKDIEYQEPNISPLSQLILETSYTSQLNFRIDSMDQLTDDQHSNG